MSYAVGQVSHCLSRIETSDMAQNAEVDDAEAVMYRLISLVAIAVSNWIICITVTMLLLDREGILR